MQTTQKAWEMLPVVGIIDPDAYTAATYLTGAIDMSKYEQVMFIVMVGTMASTSTVDFSVTESDASGGTYAAMSPAKAITQLTEAGTDSDKQVVVVVRADDLTDGKRYIKGSMVVGTAASDSGVVAIGLFPRYTPSTDIDLTTVDEIV
jgi:hypothetical protein